MLSTPRAFALPSLDLSSREHVIPADFHHLLYSIWMIPFSCRLRIAREIWSLHGLPVHITFDTRQVFEIQLSDLILWDTMDFIFSRDMILISRHKGCALSKLWRCCFKDSHKIFAMVEKWFLEAQFVESIKGGGKKSVIRRSTEDTIRGILSYFIYPNTIVIIPRLVRRKRSSREVLFQ